ncbi:CAT RNA binding domain-containing protein [Georgenia sp. M64]|uniref:CAT RNA binding domain-containing protein n=1 Tax=Georgenia sp. M64 TaxID=3120520 RepID=UPI0030DEB0E2
MGVEILRVFNNNVVLARTDAGSDVILTGRGLGFQARPGDTVDQDKVVRVFVPEDGRDPDNFGALISAIPPELLLLADQALAASDAGSGRRASSTTVVGLADHISFALERLRQGIEIEYPLRAEVAHLYPRSSRPPAASSSSSTPGSTCPSPRRRPSRSPCTWSTRGSPPVTCRRPTV